jgi:putative transposase
LEIRGDVPPVQPAQPHQHWHIDVSYLNVCATFYYLCSILDGYSRFLVHWALRESMTEADIQIILERAKERYPGVALRIISDNGPQFIAKDFKEFIRISGMTHVRTSPYYPQSNGQNRALAQTTQRGVHPPWHTAVARRCAASG